MILRRVCLFLSLFLISCGEVKTLYKFIPLSDGQLVDLKQVSEKIEGFFLTTDLSDSETDKSGVQFYVCVRFLNDPKVNKVLNKSAIPLLVQVSKDSHAPQAESLVLLHPQTKSVFYYEESQQFNFPSSSFEWNSHEYEILDFHFNQAGKVSELYFKQKTVAVEDIAFNRPFFLSAEGEQVKTVKKQSSTKDNFTEDDKDQFLKLHSFARLSSDCSSWSRLRYSHSTDIPSYLQIYDTQKNNSSQQTTNASEQTIEASVLPPITNPPPPIDLTAPFKPVPTEE